jgi:hypothetical protein
MSVITSLSAQLNLEVTDATSGMPAAFVATITDSNDRPVKASPAFPSGFRGQGSLTIPLPMGSYRVRVTRGPETRAVEAAVNLLDSTPRQLSLSLERFVNLRQRGWFGGDSHAHMIHGERTIPVTFEDVALAARAEDLQYLSLSHAWSLDSPTPENLTATLDALSDPDCVLTWNLEAPKNYYLGDAGRCLGHCWVLGLNGRTPTRQNVIDLLLEASAPDYASRKPSFANFESHHLIHQQGGAAFYSHAARWWIGPWGGQGGYPKEDRKRISNLAAELPLDTILGPTYDGLDIITGAGEFTANASSLQLWYLLLNHGYSIAPTGSSDACFDRQGGATPGSARTYTYLEQSFSLPAITRATTAGHTFVTTGPLLLASVDGHPPGTTFQPSSQPAKLQIEAWASGSTTNTLERVEVVQNANVTHRFELAGHPVHWTTNLSLDISQPGWFHVRAYASGSTSQQRAFTGAFYCRDSSHPPPAPIPATARIQILDDLTGNPIPGSVTEVQFSGPTPQDLISHTIPAAGITLSFKGTRRLRAEAPGHAPLILSPLFDNPPLLQKVTSTTADDLLTWSTYEQTQALLQNIPLVFRLSRTP